MNKNQFVRTALIFGNDNMEKIHQARVIVFGVGGVGGYVVEALVRSGLGAIDIVDKDTVSLTNLNRQLIALHSTVGKDKVDVAEERIHDINPDCKVTKYKVFYLPETADQFDFTKYDYIVDCVDTVTAKIEIIKRAKEAGKPLISCMGTGNKTDPSKLCITDISKTSVCPLARVMRAELKKRRISKVKCLFSTEKVIQPQKDLLKSLLESEEAGSGKKSIPGSTAFVPSSAGLLIASQVIKDLIASQSVK